MELNDPGAQEILDKRSRDFRITKDDEKGIRTFLKVNKRNERVQKKEELIQASIRGAGLYVVTSMTIEEDDNGRIFFIVNLSIHLSRDLAKEQGKYGREKVGGWMLAQIYEVMFLVEKVFPPEFKDIKSYSMIRVNVSHPQFATTMDTPRDVVRRIRKKCKRLDRIHPHLYKDLIGNTVMTAVKDAEAEDMRL